MRNIELVNNTMGNIELVNYSIKFSKDYLNYTQINGKKDQR